jgi:YVTN family beta-propeller protein
MYSRSRRFFSRLAPSAGVALAGLSIAASVLAAPTPNTVAGMPPVVNASNLYSEAGAGHFSPAVKDALPRIYVPNLRSNDVYVIDPATFKVLDRFHVGYSPQHVVPSWDLKTLWVANNAEGRPDGSLTPIDPR